MEKLKIYVCGHNHLLNNVPNRPFLQKVNLNELEIGKYQTNQLSESRIYFSDYVKTPVEYIGFISTRYRIKWPHLASFQTLNQLPLSPKTIYCAANLIGDRDDSRQHQHPTLHWEDWYKQWIPGIEPFFDEMIKISGYGGTIHKKGETVWANNFITSWDVFQKFLSEWRRIFDQLYDIYPPESMNFETYDNTRRSGNLYEALSALVFSHLIEKHNLNLTKMNVHNSVFKKRILLKRTLEIAGVK